MPMLYSAPVTEQAQKSSTGSTFDPNTSIDRKTAAEFVAYWANMAFDYQTRDSLANQQAAAKWLSDNGLEKRLDKSFWTKDLRTRPTQCQLVSIEAPILLDEKTAGVNVEAAFAWDSIKLKNVPVHLHFVVKMGKEGYRIDSIQIDYCKQSQFKGMLLMNCHSADLMYKYGSEYTDAKNFKDAIEKMKPDIANKNSFDAVFFSWYKAMDSAP